MQNRIGRHDEMSVEDFLDVVAEHGKVEGEVSRLFAEKLQAVSDPIDVIMTMMSLQDSPEVAKLVGEDCEMHHQLDEHANTAIQALEANKVSSTQGLLNAGLFSAINLQRRAEMMKAADLSDSDSETLTVSSLEASPVTPRM